MATIIKRKKKYSVVYYYEDEKGEKRQKWQTDLKQFIRKEIFGMPK